MRGDEWARSWGADAVRWGHGVKGRGIKRATGRGGERVRWREYEGARRSRDGNVGGEGVMVQGSEGVKG